ncbi:MAG: translocation/assembly module TamB domain-containing protein [Henriciella sp.]|uniref:translocation/assembly module TamB domain-containing protein n=1 Tax=Henriciella sp. TaxID=1968823 RepID=UPI003C733538
MAETTQNTEAQRRRPILKWSLIVLGGIAALVLILLLALRFAAQSDFGRNFVEKQIESASPSGQQIEVEGLKGDLLGRFRIERLTVSDEDGVWLVAEDLHADWKPLALRRRALLIDALEADLIHVMRRPTLTSSQSEGGGGSMPIRTGDVDQLLVREFRTDKGVLPRALSLKIEGQGALREDGGSSMISVLPLEGEGDQLLADLEWSDDYRLTGNLELDGPAGGLFASLARLDQGQSLEANLEATGTLDAWTADGQVEIEDEDALTLSAGARDDVITVEIDAHPGTHPLTQDLTDYLGDTLTVVGDISRQDGRPVIDMSAEADNLLLNALVRRAETGAYGADLRLIADDPDRFIGREDISLSRAIIDGTASYDQGAARFDGTVEASDVDVPAFRAATVSGPVVATLNRPDISVRTTLSAEQAELSGTAGQMAGRTPTLEANAQYNLSSRVLSVREFIVRGRAGRATAAGTVSLASTPTADLAGSFQLDTEAAGLSRAAMLRGQFELSRANPTSTRFTTQINASDFGDLPAPLDQWAGNQAEVSANGVYEGSGQIRLNRMTLNSGNLRASGSGAIANGGSVSASLDIDAGQAEVSGVRLSSLDGLADISGNLDNLRFEARISVPELQRGDMAFSDTTLSAGGRYAGGDLTADVDLSADSQTGPLAASTGLALSGSNWTLSDFDATWNDLQAQADLSGQGADLTSLRGEAFVNGTLPEGLPAQSIELDAGITGDRLVLDATLQQFSLGPTEAEALVVRANGTLEETNFVIELDGRTELDALSYPTSLDVDGTVSGLTSRSPLDLIASVSANLGELAFTTREPIRYTSYEDGFEATARLAALEGELAANISTRSTTAIRVEAEGMKIAPVLLLMGRPSLSGAIDINAEITETEAGTLSGPIRGELLSVSRPGSDLAPIDLFFTGNLAPDLLTMDVRALDNEALEANAQFRLPVTTSDNLPFIQRDESRQIPFEASANGQIEAIAALFVPPQMVLEGLVDLSLSGELPTLDQTFQGELNFSQGVFEHGELGMVLNRINGSATLGGGRLSLSSFEARGRSGGTLTGSGEMSIDGSGQSDVQLTADKLVVTERREGSATVSGTMTLNQQPKLLEIIGDLTVDEGQINIGKLPSGGPPTLDVSFEDPAERQEEETEEDAATRLDITLDAPGRIDVNGRGVNAELALDATITGTLGEPIIAGEARIVRGRFDLLGNRFTFGDSSVRLNREIGQSRLDISATHETNDDINAILNVVGTIDRPEVELTSNPVLPDDEVLSRVLFGRSPSQLTALETARLAAALAQLSGGGGFDLLGGIEQALGLDTFDVGSAESGGVEVTSGKYLTEDVYLEVRSGEAGAPGVAIEWEPIDNIEVEAATGSEDGQELSIQWKRDFD